MGIEVDDSVKLKNPTWESELGIWSYINLGRGVMRFYWNILLDFGERVC